MQLSWDPMALVRPVKVDQADLSHREEVILVPRPSPKSGKSDISCHMEQGHTCQESHNCIFKSRTGVSDASFHMDYYTAQFAKARDCHKVYWDS